ncbi:Phosphoribosylglycinamide formyltransferase [Cytospora mali]|uniref:Phosphoribosylglycinamide formyltransferase n=1 Tax=Cytospora mali TaxID=578113 RepID=A0A194VRM7_CYTMA|nr:Phosphoribosylglycinamide formyltransferase [Valsa mali]
MASTCRIVVLASGSGSNFQALLDAVASGRIPKSQIVQLFVNRKNAFAVTRAEGAGVPSEYFNMVSGGFQQKGEKDPERLREARSRYDAALADKVIQHSPDLIVLAGWMHVFTESFLKPLAAKGCPIINLHPALPGKYDGAGAIERAYEDFQAGKLENNKTGIMIHYVIAEVDRGQPIMTREVECREGESLEGLEQRIHSHEHDLIVEATAKVAGGILAKKGSS